MCWLRPKPSFALGMVMPLRVQISPFLAKKDIQHQPVRRSRRSLLSCVGDDVCTGRTSHPIYLTSLAASESVKYSRIGLSTGSRTDCRRSGQSRQVLCFKLHTWRRKKLRTLEIWNPRQSAFSNTYLYFCSQSEVC